MAQGCRVQAQCLGATLSWTVIRRRSGKREERARSKPSEAECCCSMHAQCCGCLCFLPSSFFSPVYLIGCFHSAGHTELLTDSFDIDYPPTSDGAAMQCQDFILRSLTAVHLLSEKGHLRYPFCEDGQAKRTLYLLHLNAPRQKMYIINFQAWVYSVYG